MELSPIFRLDRVTSTLYTSVFVFVCVYVCECVCVESQENRSEKEMSGLENLSFLSKEKSMIIQSWRNTLKIMIEINNTAKTRKTKPL